MPTPSALERRKTSRLHLDGVHVLVRRKGRLARMMGIVVDFNRYGLAIVTDQPLNKEAVVYLSIVSAETRIDNIVGVVHNCVTSESAYRCGIQFRTGSPLQDERNLTEQRLKQLEQDFMRQPVSA